MDFRLLGPLEVWDEDRQLPLREGRLRSLLAILLLHANEVVPADRLVHELWGETPPGTTANMLHVYVSRLRKALGAPARIETRKPGYRLRAEPGEIDLGRFVQLHESARRALAGGDADTAASRLREALSLWRGPPLGDVALEPFAQVEIVRLEEAHAAALEDRIDADLALGAHAEVIGELEALAAEHPLRERLRAQLMLALYRSGRQADALRVYTDTRRVLVDELGIEPGTELQRLEKAVLLQDPALDAAPRRPPSRPSTRERKLVSVVFVDVEPVGRPDPEALALRLEPAFAKVQEIVAGHGGSAEPLGGESLAGAFGVPVVHEDDALRALRAALEICVALGAEHGLAARIAVGSGHAVVGAGALGRSLLGLRPVARPEPGEVLANDETERLVRSAARLERVDGAWRVLGLRSQHVGAEEPVRRPLVGRDDELDQLLREFERVERRRTCHLVTLLGPAGIGKSRLVAELRTAVADRALVVAGRCLPYGEGIAFWPLGEIVRQLVPGEDAESELAGLLEDDADAALVAARIVGASGLGDRAAAPAEETAWAARRLFEALARMHPLVVVLDDLQWAEPPLLRLVEHVAELARDVPILLLCLARPELLDDRPAWGGGKLNATSILLEPLSPEEAARFVDTITTTVPPGLRDRICETAEGNPLFVEQMLAMLEHGGPPDAAIPPTIEALLSARLDRLPVEERAVLQHAAVIGKEFWPGAVSDLLPEQDRPELNARMDALVRKELVRPARSVFFGERSFRFRHLLIRDAAYETLPKAARSHLHERFAEWLERTETSEEIVGYHLEQAHRYRHELDASDPGVRRLADRASERLASAGRRAYARGDVAAASTLLSRASVLLDPQDARRLELLPELGDALRERGDFARSRDVAEEAIAGARACGLAEVEWHARVARLRLRLMAEPQAAFDELAAEAEACVTAFERLGDDLGLARAWSALAYIPWRRCRAEETEAALQPSLERAHTAGDVRTEMRVQSMLLGTALNGPLPVPAAIRRCEDMLAKYADRQRVVVSALRALVPLKAMATEFDEAHELAERAKTMCDELGLTVVAVEAADAYRLAWMLEGDPAEAERELRVAEGILAGLGVTTSTSTLLGGLADAVCAQGRYDEALELARKAERLASSDDVITQMEWRMPCARALAHRGTADEAERLAREAVEVGETTDFLNVHADALLTLAEVLTVVGRDGAESARGQALELYERKGNVAALAQLRESLPR